MKTGGCQIWGENVKKPVGVGRQFERGRRNQKGGTFRTPAPEGITRGEEWGLETSFYEWKEKKKSFRREASISAILKKDVRLRRQEESHVCHLRRGKFGELQNEKRCSWRLPV